MAIRISGRGKYQFTCLQADIDTFDIGSASNMLDEGMIGFVTDKHADVLYTAGTFKRIKGESPVFVQAGDQLVTGTFTGILMLTADVAFETLDSNLKTATGAAWTPPQGALAKDFLLPGVFYKVKLQAGQALLLP